LQVHFMCWLPGKGFGPSPRMCLHYGIAASGKILQEHA
jgi:hypothetical protein